LLLLALVIGRGLTLLPSLLFLPTGFAQRLESSGRKGFSQALLALVDLPLQGMISGSGRSAPLSTARGGRGRRRWRGGVPASLAQAAAADFAGALLRANASLRRFAQLGSQFLVSSGLLLSVCPRLLSAPKSLKQRGPCGCTSLCFTHAFVLFQAPLHAECLPPGLFLLGRRLDSAGVLERAEPADVRLLFGMSVCGTVGTDLGQLFLVPLGRSLRFDLVL
jgi:hypothetical protein